MEDAETLSHSSVKSMALAEGVVWDFLEATPSPQREAVIFYLCRDLRRLCCEETDCLEGMAVSYRRLYKERVTLEAEA